MDQTLTFVRENFEAVALLVSVVLGFLGSFVAHISSARRQKADARLKHVSDQVEKLYGPLYSLTEANTASWQAFRKSFRPDEPFISEENPFTEREKVIWRAWAENVFIPSNLKIRNVIESNAHLFIEGEMPDCFRLMLAHVESSKIVLPALAENDLKILDGFDSWPSEFNDFVEQRYRAMAQEYARLLGRRRGLSPLRKRVAKP
ncbi:MAG: hypothetical protein AAGC96_21925 [Pseudomonadota bacterium]